MWRHALSHVNVLSWTSGRFLETSGYWKEEAMGIAITLAQYLLDRGVSYDLVPHPHTETAMASVVASGLPSDSVVKGVVLKGVDGFKVALLPASRHIDFKRLRRLLGDEVDLAGEEQVETLFADCEPGSVPALAAAYGSMSSWTTAWAPSPLSIWRAATMPIWFTSAAQAFGS